MAQPTLPVEFDDANVRRARKRAEDVRGFYVHALVYLSINAGLVVLDAVTGGGWWFYWVAIPWGIGLATHAVAVLADRVFGEEWEQRKVAAYLRREDERHH